MIDLTPEQRTRTATIMVTLSLAGVLWLCWRRGKKKLSVEHEAGRPTVLFQNGRTRVIEWFSTASRQGAADHMPRHCAVRR
jgi:hypothetical protein